MRDKIGGAIGWIIADATLRFVAAGEEFTIDDLRKYADEILAKMREPSAEMVFAANCLTAKQIIMPGMVWETMIEAASQGEIE